MILVNVRAAFAVPHLLAELEKPVPEAVIVSALRTPIGTARKGTLRDTSAFDLAHHVVTEAAKDLDPAQEIGRAHV